MLTIRHAEYYNYPNCSYVDGMRIEADPDISGIGVREEHNTSPIYGTGWTEG